MRLTRRIIASRANGRRSRGPKTAAGKQRSSMNALRHGLLSKCVVMPEESQQTFDMLLNQFIDKLQPVDDVEQNYIEDIAGCIWRTRRMWAMETRLLAGAASKRTESDPLERIARGFSELAKQPDLHLLLRYQATFSNIHQRALRNFLELAEFTHYETNLDSRKTIEINSVDPVSQAPEVS